MYSLSTKLSVFIGFFLFAILLNSAGAVILQVQRYFNVTESSAAVVEMCKDISLGTISFLVAAYITRVGYKKSMLAALAVMAAACFLIPSVKTFLAIKILFAAAGACFGLMKIAVLGTIGIITKNEKEHLSMMNFLESFFMLGILTGYFVFSYYIDDAEPGSSRWFNVYYLLGTSCILVFFLLLFSPLKEPEVNDENRVTAGGGGLPGMLKLLGIPLIVSFIAGIFMYSIIEQSIMCWLPTFNNKQLSIVSSLSVQVAGILMLSVAAGRFITGFLLKRTDWLKVLVFCLLAIFLILATALSFTGQPGHYGHNNNWSELPLIAYLFPLLGLFMAPVYPVINSVILSSLPKGRHAMVAGLIVVFSSAGGMSGSVITGFIFQSEGGKSAFYFSLLPVIMLIAILYNIKKNKTSYAGKEEICKESNLAVT